MPALVKEDRMVVLDVFLLFFLQFAFLQQILRLFVSAILVRIWLFIDSEA